MFGFFGMTPAQLRQQIDQLCDLADQLMAQLNAAAGERRDLEAKLAKCQKRIAEREAKRARAETPAR